MRLLFYRKLEVLLDRSWEKESITWNGLTWWDPLPCGRDFVVQVKFITNHIFLGSCSAFNCCV